jgi:NTE family protein
VRLLRTALPPGARVEEAAYPLNIVVTRALEGTREVIRNGSLESAIVASTAIPGIFPPVDISGSFYVNSIDYMTAMVAVFAVIVALALIVGGALASARLATTD